MKTSDFYYDLPQELIAQDPLEDRSSSRLMHLSLKDGSIEHRHFTDILDYLHKGDCLVINDTKVIPARLYGSKVGTDAGIEILLLKRKENNIWETLVKPGKKAPVGRTRYFTISAAAPISPPTTGPNIMPVISSAINAKPILMKSVT